MAQNRIIMVQTPDRNINQLQQNIQQALHPLLASPLANGVLLEDVSLLAGPNVINHTLGRILRGWFVTRLQGAAQVYDAQEANLFQSKTLALVSSANVVVDLFVF